MLSAFHTLEFNGNFHGRSFLLEIHNLDLLKGRFEDGAMDVDEDLVDGGIVDQDEEVDAGLASESRIFSKVVTSEGIQMPFVVETFPGSYRAYVCPMVDGSPDEESEFFCNYQITQQDGGHIKFVIDRIEDDDGAEEGIRAIFEDAGILQ